MKTSDLWQTYKDYTKDFTEHARKLAFAGAAICWFFKTPQLTFPPLINWALVFFVGFFITDVLQSFCGALLTKRFAEKKEFELFQKNGNIDGEVEKPRWLDWPAYGSFLLKSVSLLIGFVFVGCELIHRLG